MAHPAARYLAIIDATITDDFLERRTKAAVAASNRWRKLPTPALALDKAGMVADALIDAAAGRPVPDVLRQEIGGDIRKAAPLHDPGDEGRDFEVAVVAAVAAIMALGSTAARTEGLTVFAQALSVTMDASGARGPVRVSELWNELAEAARKVGDGDAEASRDRVPIDPADTAGALAALAANALRDREEIDVLWWTLGDWSALAGARLSSLSTADGVVAAAIELSSVIRWPAVRALRQLAHRNLQGLDTCLALAELRVADASLRQAIDRALNPVKGVVATHPRAFAALGAVIADATGSPLPATAAEAVDQPAWRWTERVVRELSLARSAGVRLGPIG